MKALLGMGLVLFAGLVNAQATKAGDLTATLAKLDAASAKFTTAEARVHRELFTYLGKDTETQDGTIYFVREKSGATQMGLKTEGPRGRTVEYKNGTIRAYNPGANCYDTVTRPGVDTYLTLGFGGSGKDLARAWDITDLGPTNIEGVKVEHLVLVPIDNGVKASVSKVELWLDLDRDVSLKQLFYLSGKDTNTATFTAINTTKKPNLKAYAFGGKPCGQ